MRGGTSKALFFHESMCRRPRAGARPLLKRAMGTLGVLQSDGMGGSRLVTSRIAMSKKSARPGVLRLGDARAPAGVYSTFSLTFEPYGPSMS